LPLSRALLGYLHRVYGAQLGALPPDAPIWVSLSNHHRGGALSLSAIADVCEQRLGTSKVHQLRHTFARMLEDAGAKISVIQQRLGHASAATTSIYLQTLRADENPYAEELIRVLGVEG
jgi:integrase